jgi:flagellar basal body-associated protein FliL
MRTRKQKIIILLTVLTVIFLVLSVAFFVFRNSLYRKPSKKFQLRWNKNTIVVSVQEASLKVYRVSLTEITVPKDADTLLALKDENQCQHLAFAL